MRGGLSYIFLFPAKMRGKRKTKGTQLLCVTNLKMCAMYGVTVKIFLLNFLHVMALSP